MTTHMLVVSALSAAIAGSLIGQPTAAAPQSVQPADHQHDAQGNDIPKSSVTIEVKDGFRYITSNGIPDHEPGKFPNRNNPNSISAQSYKLRVPVTPQAAEKSWEVGHQLFGVALNGVVFDAATAEFWNDDPRGGWNMEAIAPSGVKTRNLGLDQNNAHVQPNGAYHYHSSPTGLVVHIAATEGVRPAEAMILVGWAADGYPIYNAGGYAKAEDTKSGVKKLKASYRLKQGERPGGEKGPGGKYDGEYTADWEYVVGLGDLDECNGRTGVTPEFPGGTYYYVLTDEFPYVPRLYHGVPDGSFARKGPPPPGGRGPGRGGPPDGSGGRRPPPDHR